jgi:NAD(P)-dependent dehydrogenase (short-subunit alcohol dehydrogenase family)
MGQMHGKVAIVTGGACGIGAACARTLAREDAKVAVTDLDDANGETLVTEIRHAGGDAIYLHQDVTDEGRWPEVVGAVEKQFGRVDVMVANAGIAIRVPIVDMTLADWRRQQAVNVEGVFLAVKYAVPAMRRSGGGSIVIMSSLAGLRGAAGLGGYCATKGGVRLLAKAAAIEHAEDNIRVL